MKHEKIFKRGNNTLIRVVAIANTVDNGRDGRLSWDLQICSKPDAPDYVWVPLTDTLSGKYTVPCYATSEEIFETKMELWELHKPKLI